MHLHCLSTLSTQYQHGVFTGITIGSLSLPIYTGNINLGVCAAHMVLVQPVDHV